MNGDSLRAMSQLLEEMADTLDKMDAQINNLNNQVSYLGHKIDKDNELKKTIANLLLKDT